MGVKKKIKKAQALPPLTVPPKGSDDSQSALPSLGLGNAPLSAPPQTNSETSDDVDVLLNDLEDMAKASFVSDTATAIVAPKPQTPLQQPLQQLLKPTDSLVMKRGGEEDGKKEKDEKQKQGESNKSSASARASSAESSLGFRDTVVLPPTTQQVTLPNSAMPSGNSSNRALKNNTPSDEGERKVRAADKKNKTTNLEKYPSIVGVALKNPTQLDGMDVNRLKHELGRLNKLQKRLNQQVVSRSKSSNRDVINTYLGNLTKASGAISAALLKKNR